MSGFADVGPQTSQFSYLTSTGIGSDSNLYRLLMATEILPGDEPSYELCKLIYVYHPLGGKMTDSPVKLAMSQQRELAFANGPEDRLREQFLQTWAEMSVDRYIRDTRILAKVYGQSALVCGERGKPTTAPIDFAKLGEADLYFSVLDPLNTSSGSMSVDQDPNSPTFLRPRNVTVSGKRYHGSRSFVQLNGPPVYIQWSNSSFGFTGRSVYQRALFPLKTFLQTMISDDAVTKKAALLIAKIKQAGSIATNLSLGSGNAKRQLLQSGVTGNVLQVGVDDSIETLNFSNLEGPAKFARDNCLKNIASANDMPAQLLNQETLAEGFGEGTEDAKQIAKYVERERYEMDALYGWFDKIVMHRAWTPAFYETIQATEPDYRNVPYETAFQDWVKGFSTTWPNLLSEPDSEKRKGDKEWGEVLFGATAALAPLCQDQTNKAALAMWISENLNARKGLFTTPLELDQAAIETYEPPLLDLPGGDETKEPKPRDPRA
jgi:hypothetical protein